MTAPESNFCCATDLAPMSEPGVYGVGIIGIVSYSPTTTITINTHTTCVIPPAKHAQAALIRNENRINLQVRPVRFVTPIYRNLASACCKMDEQTGSASETKCDR
jgi:hypothetical protein